MIWILELGAALIGGALLFREAIDRRFQNFLTSVFLLCYVPLFCFYPILARILVGGATSINKYQPGLIGDIASYLVYQAGNYGILAVIWLVHKRSHDAEDGVPRPPPAYEAHINYLTLIFCAGIYLSIRATGLSVSELLVAVRFTWFRNESYSPFLSVLSTYLIALSPLIIYLCVMDGRWRTLIFVLILLTLNGVLFKDRKWLIFIGSGLLAAQYSKNGRRFAVDMKRGLWLLLLAVTLWFWQTGRDKMFLILTEGRIDHFLMIPGVMADSLVRGDVPYYYNASMTAIHMNLQDGYEIPFGILRRQLFFFLPANFSFGLKIEDISAIFSDAIGGGDLNRRGNMPPGLFGLFVLSLGWLWGVIGIVLFPLVLKGLDRIARKGRGVIHVAIVSHALSSMVYLLRGDDSSATYFVIFTMMVLAGMVLKDELLGRFRSRWIKRFDK